jgi:hypothetical protein
VKLFLSPSLDHQCVAATMAKATIKSHRSIETNVDIGLDCRELGRECCYK